MSNYDYPDSLENVDRMINLWAQLKTETGAAGVTEKVAEINAVIAEKLAELRALPDDPALQDCGTGQPGRDPRAASRGRAALLVRAAG